MEHNEIIAEFDKLIRKQRNLPDDFVITDEWLSKTIYEEDMKSGYFYWGNGVTLDRNGKRIKYPEFDSRLLDY
jgi:hypothetical protein